VALHPAFGPHLGGTTALDARLAFAGTLVQAAGGGARPGILSGVATLVTSRADRYVDVAGFTVALSRGAADGVSLLANDGTVQVEIASAPAANSRYDVLWVRQRDSVTAIAPDPDNLAVFGVTPGNASATPSLANTLGVIPRGAVALASILVPAGATTTNGMTIGQIAPFTAAAGSAFAVRKVDELTAALLGDTPVAQKVYVADPGVLYEVRLAGTTKRWARLSGGTFVGVRSSQLVGSGGPSGIGAFTRDATFSDRDEFFTPTSTTLAEGDYVVSCTMGGVNATGRCFIEIAGGGTSARNGFGAGEDTATVTSALHIRPGGESIAVRAFLTVASAVTPTFRMQITKTG